MRKSIAKFRISEMFYEILIFYQIKNNESEKKIKE
jgi:hypothetical protein